jgi:hypothetical protein
VHETSVPPPESQIRTRLCANAPIGVAVSVSEIRASSIRAPIDFEAAHARSLGEGTALAWLHRRSRRNSHRKPLDLPFQQVCPEPLKRNLPRAPLYASVGIEDDTRNAVLNAFRKATERKLSQPDCYLAGVRAWRDRHPDHSPGYAAKQAVAIILATIGHELLKLH